jgi:hypothetical protein
MTDSRWELPIVLLMATTTFWLVWHFAAHILS